jgi:hypothetical protein
MFVSLSYGLSENIVKAGSNLENLFSKIAEAHPIFYKCGKNKKVALNGIV